MYRVSVSGICRNASINASIKFDLDYESNYKFMARRSLGERNRRSLNKLGNGSYTISIPVEHVRALRWQKKQSVTVELVGKKLVVKDWKSPRQKRKG